jgi:DNA ligase 1
MSEKEIKIYPTLYKKTSTGAIQFWTISVKATYVERPIGTLCAGNIRTQYGQIGTDSPQITDNLILHGKNEGKKNATTPLKQAEAEALAKWEKQKKKGYVDSKEAAEKGEVDDIIEGGIVPMLAHKFAEQAHKIKYPAYVQPKLDGIRCIAIVKDGKCTLWSRTRKPITGVPHIIKAIEEGLPKGNGIVLDGELYNHEFKKDFEKIVSFVRQEEPAPGHEIVQYHVYDIVNEDPFSKRATKLRYFKEGWFKDGCIVKVQTFQVEDESQTLDWFQQWRKEGFEGAMIRNADGLYVNKRSYDLQKVKEFDDAEFEIVGIDEGRGKLAGHVGAFVCRMADGKEFLAKMSGDTENLKRYFDTHSLWEGKKLTVKYQGLTGANGVPRFPVGVTIRDYE